MNKSVQIIEIGILSGFLGIVFEYFGAIRLVFIILAIMIFIDTITGIMVGMKHLKFSFRGAMKIIRKFITYGMVMVTVRLLEISMQGLFETTVISQIMGVFLVINESISILENLAVMGVPLPSNFILILLGQITIPGINLIFKSTSKSHSKSEEWYANDIDDIIRYQIPAFDDECMKKMLEIKLSGWKLLIIQLKGIFIEQNDGNKDLAYYKILNYVQNMNSEIENRWNKEGISRKCIEAYNSFHSVKMEKWLQKVKKLCYSDDDKKNKEAQFIESVMILLYQTVIDARKGFESSKGVN